MNRKAFDKLASLAGIILAAILVAGGALALWGHSYASNTVSSQLAAQKIVFPAKNSQALSAKALPAAARTAMLQYAGQRLDNGRKAEVYANNFIAVHLSEMGGTYSQLSEKYITMTPAQQASPAGQKLAGLRQTVFMGTSLRGMLLDAYGWWQMGQIALYAAWVAFAGAALFVLLVIGGLAHARKVAPSAQLFARKAAAPAAA